MPVHEHRRLCFRPRVVAESPGRNDREQLVARPIPGKWSTLEVICHLADFEIVYTDRIKRVIAENEPTMFAGDPDQFAAGWPTTNETPKKSCC